MQRKKKKLFTAHCSLLTVLLLTAHCSLLTVCSFDYGDLEPVESNMPDLVMENVEYTRVRSAKPQARFQAERAERYESRRVMILENLEFEQFGATIEEVNARGFAGNATIEIDSGNILMENAVKIEVESEDMTLETNSLKWIDESNNLSSDIEDEVIISMDNGTVFSGTGFTADTAERTWEFASNVSGRFVAEEDEEEFEDNTHAALLDELDQENILENTDENI